ncbi:MAG: aminomethyl-transferring glycine dehydrogenase subunit GcvPB [bacterium]
MPSSHNPADLTTYPGGSVPVIFYSSVPGRMGVSLPQEAPDTQDAIRDAIPSRFHRMKRESSSDDHNSSVADHAVIPLPELGEMDVVRHFTRLSTRVMCVDTTFYPLGSCTMKYNPKINEAMASLPGFLHIHPAQPDETMQGMLRIYHEFAGFLAELTGLVGVSLQPPAGAQGEFTALLVAKAYFKDRGEHERRDVIIPDTAHGTNPASAWRAGFHPVEQQSGSDGRMDVDKLLKMIGSQTACVMITNPNTLGLFERRIGEVSVLIHDAGALLYIDGANFNALVGRVRPADFGADLMHINLHKTFAVPHGGGGPGAGPICVRDFLAPYLPSPHIRFDGKQYQLVHDCPKSIGKVRSFFGNMMHIVRSYVYIRQLGAKGLRDVSGHATLNANYLLALLAGAYDIPYGNRCMHEFVINATRQKNQGVRAMDIAKKLIDYGFHPPTTYFPLIVPEALMIEPTETESKETLESFAETMLEIARQAERDPGCFSEAPQTAPVTRMDELTAARQPILKWQAPAD